MYKETELEDLLKLIGNNMYALRTQRKVSLKTVSKAVNLPPMLLTRIEGGLNDYALEYLIVLCSYYKVSPKDMLSVDLRKAKRHGK